MNETIADAITRLIRYQRVPDSATSYFQSVKHNRDILPLLQRQLEIVLTAYGKFQPIVYDTQGINDDGSDIVLRYQPPDSQLHPTLIGFQVKSFDDLAKRTYLQELKAQRDDSFRKVFGLQQYYIVLCTDGLAHKGKIRSIAAEFRSATQTEVIEPSYALTFFRHPKTRVEALVKRLHEVDDIVFRLALNSVDSFSPSAKALAIYLVIRSIISGGVEFAVRQLSETVALRTIYDELREQQTQLLQERASGDEASADDDDYDEYMTPLADFETQLAADVDELETDVIDFDGIRQSVVVRRDHVIPLTAVAADALARYEYNEAELISYMYSLMGVRD